MRVGAETEIREIPRVSGLGDDGERGGFAHAGEERSPPLFSDFKLCLMAYYFIQKKEKKSISCKSKL